ncbi:MAG: P1 family peptidase [Rhodospirillales bacterium]|nr:P1 family peptidase [Rhodospirillales bacterium]
MAVAPGPRNLITDVDGILVGQAEDRSARTGTTVVLPERRCVAGADVRGGAPGTRDVEALDPTCLVDAVDAIVLSGGSAFGLDAASGVMAWLVDQERGFAAGGHIVPIVPAAILYDLANGGDKSWRDTPPYRELGRSAAQSAGSDVALGNAGAGIGATAGALKGGLGSASAITDDGLQVGALVAVNAAGSAIIPGTRTLWASLFEQQQEMGSPPRDLQAGDMELDASVKGFPAENTTIGVVTTNAALDRAQARRVAIMAHDGLARAIRPIHTPFDGDTVFCLATGTLENPVEPAILGGIGALAADCMTRAVGRAMVAAESIGELVAYKDWLVC